MPTERYRDALSESVRGLTVAVAEQFFFEHSAADIVAPVRSAVGILADAGAIVTEIDMQWPVAGPDRFSFYDAEQAAALASTGRRGAISWARTWCTTSPLPSR